MKFTFRFIVSIILLSSHAVHSQSFTKITSGAIVNDGGWSYGCCWADFNNDGKQDLFVCNNQTGNKNNMLYMNNGDGTFTKVTAGIVVSDGGSSYGCTAADYDNNGTIDLFVSNYAENNFLYINNGGGSFTKITTGNIVNDGGNSTGCAWADYDKDGYIDLFVCNRNQANFLYHNNGNGAFTKITSGAIVTNVSNSGGCAWADYDNDGYPDLFVANAGPAADFLYHNNGNGSFTQVTGDPVVSDIFHSSGGSWGDYNNDGYQDLFVTCGVIGSGNDRLFRNNGNGTFTKITSDPIVNTVHWAGGSSWGDFNNDGWLDMFVGGYDGPNFLFRNDASGSFVKIDTGILATDGNYKEGAGWCDYDNDGNLDIFTARNNYFGGNNCLYHNNGTGNKFLNVKCVGMVSNKCGIGAKVYVKANTGSGSIMQMREISSQTGGAISGENCLNAVFGLGNTTIVDSLIIKWPSGVIDRYGQLQPDRFLTAVEGQGITDIIPVNSVITSEFSLLQNYPNPFNPVTNIGFELVKAGNISIKVFDISGREYATEIKNLALNPGNYEIKFNGSELASGI
ncbi:MAG: FG-GAP-like repeat-containing protein, partial [Ignavibacteria bacterium]|nr:FG-GAP-like repeat-containing protein [Ignavibacteria bacterium]